ncbi:aquaporin Z [Xenophilus arseniciresistens]|uniref:Aquaporin Z n=1 Tax=Xenophilus arseniciresistens TaxID=1283306 RepID=A0AAE3NAL8_9BURK|nr:aquaporin Z [Xenophilus arseniciresistens]MDA7417654.1 aquaporin Z [Xenophilus arseniciresistens]
MQPSNLQKWSAELIGTFWLTFGGCGSAVLAAAFPNVGIGLLGVSLAFGLTVLTGAYAFGPISGGHFNPAVSVGLAVGGRFRWAELPGYVIAQTVGALLAGFVLYQIATGKPGAEVGGFATNGFGAHSPGGFGMTAAIWTEVVLTAVFLLVILGATARRAAAGFGGLAIGLALTLIHLISIPVTNTSVNPARSTGVAVFGPAIAIEQLWFFWLMPIVGAAIGALIYKALLAGGED